MYLASTCQVIGINRSKRVMVIYVTQHNRSNFTNVRTLQVSVQTTIGVARGQ